MTTTTENGATTTMTTANRLTESDRDTIAAAMRGAVTTGADPIRVGLNAIGCTRLDMRTAELNELDMLAAAIVGAERATFDRAGSYHVAYGRQTIATADSLDGAKRRLCGALGTVANYLDAAIGAHDDAETFSATAEDVNLWSRPDAAAIDMTADDHPATVIVAIHRNGADR